MSRRSTGAATSNTRATAHFGRVLLAVGTGKSRRTGR
jgi:hypothetical protein